MADALAVEGLDQLIRTAGRMSKDASKQLRQELRVGVGGEFVRDVKARIDDEGLVRSGKLRGSIRPAVRGSTLVVRSSPPLKPGKKSPQGYARIYEYGARGADESVGPRAFLGPTLDEWRTSGKLDEAMNGYMEWVEQDWTAGA